jgi:hypothetical protein
MLTGQENKGYHKYKRMTPTYVNNLKKMLQLIVSVSNSINAVNCSFEYVVQVQFSLLFQDIQDE